jgi:vacuolar-type H+-ATPase catalytic subunit A/Vma1
VLSRAERAIGKHNTSECQTITLTVAKTFCEWFLEQETSSASDLISRLRYPRVVSRAAWRIAMEVSTKKHKIVRTKYVRAHVIVLRASASWSLEQKAECIARRL